MPAEGIEQAAVGGDVDQRAVGMLAVDLGQRTGDLAQQVEAHRLVVDGGAARAVGILDAADDEFALGIDALLLQDGEGRVRCAAARRPPSPRRARHRPAPGEESPAGAQRQSQRIEQDGFARTRFAGEHGEALVERDVELLDQDDVANGKSGQHGRTYSGDRRAARREADYSGLIAGEGLGDPAIPCSRPAPARRWRRAGRHPCTIRNWG